MKRSLFCACALTVASAPATAASCGAHEQALREAKTITWPDLYRRQDVAGLAAFLTDTFVMIGADGQTSTRSEEIAWLRAHPWQPNDFQYAIDFVECPAPNIALIVGRGRSVRVDDKGRPVAHQYASSNVLVLDQGRWRAAMSHVSGETSVALGGEKK